MKKSHISIFLLTVWLAPLIAPNPKIEDKKKAYLKKIKEAMGDLEKSTLIAVIGSYFFHAGLLAAASLLALKWNGFELWVSFCSFIWLMIAIARLVSGFRLIKMVEPGGTGQPM